MEWIKVEDVPFVEIIHFDDGKYMWVETKDCPDEPFLVGLWVFDEETDKKYFETHLVILTDDGLEDWTDEGSFLIESWEVIDIEYWCKIEPPE